MKRRFGEHTNTTTLIIPTHIANRYGERPIDLEGLDLETKHDDISLRIEILESAKIQSIDSISHEIMIERGIHTGKAHEWDQIGQESNETAIVTMKEACSWLETDFILSVDTACNQGIAESEGWLEMHPTLVDQAAMMVTLPPRVLLSQNDICEDGEILFVADRSGSMGNKMTHLKSAMHFFLKGIPVGRTFNIWCFGSDYQPLWNKSQVYGRESLQLALDYVDTSFSADMGGTEILPALEAVIAARDPSLPCDVVVLTDGEVWRLDETLSLVHKANKSSKGAIRFFSLGLGNHVSHTLVDGIAKQGGGYSEIIPHADKEGWEDRVVAILKSLLTRHIYDLSLDLGGLKGMTSPKNLESLNPFDANRIFLLLEEGKVPDNDGFTLTLVSGGKHIPINVSVTKMKKPGMLIHNLSARAILDDLERAVCNHAIYQPKSWLNNREAEKDLSRSAELLACKYSLPSKWTSLFLLQEPDELCGREATSRIVTKVMASRSGDILSRTRGLQRPQGNRYSMCGSGKSQNTYQFQGPISSRQRLMDSLQRTRKDFVHLILSHQDFNGSIANDVLENLPEGAHDVLNSLKKWLQQKTDLTGVALDLVANTALTVAFLERDYQERKDLWVMIREKALAYIRLQISHSNLENGLMEYSRESLSEVARPTCMKRKAASASGFAIKKRKKERDVNADDEDHLNSDRVSIHEAPLD